MELSRYISSEAVEVARSRITPSGYNPRRMSEGARNLLRENIKQLGLMGGIVWNAPTGNLVGGRQKLSVLDGLHRYDPATMANDYLLRVERVDPAPKEDREQNIFLNNPNAQGELDGNLLRDIVADIDPALAGLDAFGLSLLGIDAAPVETDGNPPNGHCGPGIHHGQERSGDGAGGGSRPGGRRPRYAGVFRTVAARASFMARFGPRPMESAMDGEDFGRRAMPVPNGQWTTNNRLMKSIVNCPLSTEQADGNGSTERQQHGRPAAEARLRRPDAAP